MTQKTGFTLIELLVVVLIIGILAAVALPMYKVSVLKSQTAELLLNVRTMRQNMDIYYLENGQWATAMPDILEIQYTSLRDDGGANWKENGCMTAVNGNFYTIDVDGYIAGYLKNGRLNIMSWNKPQTSGLWAGKFNCRAPANDSAANQACMSMGGILNGQQSASTNVYRLQ
ncbi:MAG: prepilin-type N-terminal cleavage/methylation domain-containing protein [Elusimicrobium sp.]|jgi:prepilin-type N-terminal cleavage/methylation domain-containing protein|nr:prepilin-type N-terminal cleavage/methylation domain-containing protein [Elusimicrobium sp.]